MCQMFTGGSERARHPAAPPIRCQLERAHWFKSANGGKVRAAGGVKQWLASEVRLVSNPASSDYARGEGKGRGVVERGSWSPLVYSGGYPGRGSLVVGGPWWCEVSLPLGLVFVSLLRKIESSLVRKE